MRYDLRHCEPPGLSGDGLNEVLIECVRELGWGDAFTCPFGMLNQKQENFLTMQIGLEKPLRR